MATIESLSIDEIIDKALTLCSKLPQLPEYSVHSRNIKELRDRLAGGRLQIAVLGQFNRGKSSFINSLLRMKVLPISVLPITSVPTIISYSKTNQCIISFSDEKKDIAVRGNTDVITNQLTKYVTEKNNPTNRLNVSQVIVKCNSQLLQHGTVIIDTPGFGSTITHNTQTTLDLLSSCDATFFIFSADLPITQTEVDFLKKVIKTVKKIFFIYNKIDLIGGKDQHVSMRFIKDTLANNLEFTSGVQLFPVSAKLVNCTEKEDGSFVKSGIARIEKEIIDFLLREKYFTLSQALINKFKDALKDIITILELKRNELLAPLNQTENEIIQLKNSSEKVRCELEEMLNYSKSEKKSLYNYFDTIVEEKRNELRELSEYRLRELLIALPTKNPENIINVSLSFLIEEIFNRLRMFMLSELNKPLRNTMIVYLEKVKHLVHHIGENSTVSFEENRLNEKRIELIQFDSTTIWKSGVSFTINPPKKSLLNRFVGYDKLYKQFVEFYSTEIYKKIDMGIEEFKLKIESQISSMYDSFNNDINQDYTKILNTITQNYKIIDENFLIESEKAKPLLEQLGFLIEGFKEIDNDIV